MVKVGVDLGGTNTKFGFFNEDNELINDISIPTSKDKELIIQNIIKIIKDNYKDNEIMGITCCIPGVTDNDIVIYAPNTNIAGLNFYNELKKAFNNDNIIVENDANMAALAESRITNTNDLVMITLGTGIGGGIIIDNKLYNKNGFAGEIGHIKVDFSANSRPCNCGSSGCIESYASARTIVYEYNSINNTNITSKELFELANENDKLAIDTINNSIDKLGIALANIVTTLAIKEIRITGGLINAGDYLLEKIRYYYQKYALPNLRDINIEFASLGSEAGIYAAKYLIE